MAKLVTHPQVAVVLLNWNNPEDTLACLRSLAVQSYPTAHTIVVDNGSTDDSVARIRAAFPEIEILETGANLGYAGGNNAGIRRGLDQGADYVLILNNDVLVAPDFLSGLLKVAQANADVVTPLIADLAHPSVVWTAGARVNWQRGTVERLHAGDSVLQLQPQAPFEVEVAPGSAMLVKRQVFERAGLLEESFFLYFEEADWCLGVRQAGFRILVAPSSIVWHKVSATLGQASPVTDYYMARNQWRFIARHWTGLARLRVLTGCFVGQAATIGAYTVKPQAGERTPNRNARLLGLRDALLGRSGEIGAAARIACGLEQK